MLVESIQDDNQKFLNFFASWREAFRRAEYDASLL